MFVFSYQYVPVVKVTRLPACFLHCCCALAPPLRETAHKCPTTLPFSHLKVNAASSTVIDEPSVL